MLQPKLKPKYNKIRKGSFKLKKLNFPKTILNKYTILSIESGYIHPNQLEASRQTISRHIEKKGKIRIFIFPSLAITKKSIQVRIGKGAGKVKYWVFRIDPGKPIFEVSGVSKTIAKSALNSGAQKLPLKVRILLN